MDKTTVTKGQAYRAGIVLRDDNAPAGMLDEAGCVLSAWRNMHTAPVAAASRLPEAYTSPKGLWPEALVSRRMKRMPFITGRLRRFPAMQEAGMQDIGGVHVIAETIQDVYGLYHAIADNKKLRQLLALPPDDYSARPQRDGYRSLHQVFSYESGKHPEANGLRTELQIRTRLQYAWAAAVETPAAVEGASLRTGEGSDAVQRCFQVASALFSLDEGQPVTESCKGMSPKELVREYEAPDARPGATAKLRTVAVRQLPKSTGRGRKRGLLLLVLHMSPCGDSRPDVQRCDSLPIAEMAYSGIERLNRNNPDVYVLLMNTNKVSQLQQAYPDYCLDASLFLENIRRVCEKYRQQPEGKERWKEKWVDRWMNRWMHSKTPCTVHSFRSCDGRLPKSTVSSGCAWGKPFASRSSIIWPIRSTSASIFSRIAGDT